MAHDIHRGSLLSPVGREVLLAVEGCWVDEPIHSAGKPDIEDHLARDSGHEPAMIGGGRAGTNREPCEGIVAVWVCVLPDPYDPVPGANDPASELEIKRLIVDDCGSV